jgi:hypothetical protein
VGPEVAPLTRAELDVLVGWAADEGWNPGLADAERFWAADPDGFIALRDEGEMVGGGAVVSYGGELGFIGLFIVEQARRGRGLGGELWPELRETLERRLVPGAAIGLDGVLAMEPFYAADGFRTAHRHLRMRGTGSVATPDRALRPLADVPFETVAALDRACFGCDRRSFLRPWIEPAGGLALGLPENGELRGFGVARPCREGFKIGPLFADGGEAAERILRALASHAAGGPYFLDVPDRNAEAVGLADGLGLEQVFACARMYRGEPPAQDWDRVFGATTLELG